MEKTEIENEIKQIEVLLEKIIIRNKDNLNLHNLQILCAPLLWRLSCLKSDNPQPMPLVKLFPHDIDINVNINK
jgi:hypothetical protein